VAEDLATHCPVPRKHPLRRYSRFEDHHWYDEKGVRHSKRICYECNSMLTDLGQGKDNHILPPWKVQVEWLLASERLEKCLAHKRRAVPLAEAIIVCHDFVTSYRKWWRKYKKGLISDMSLILVCGEALVSKCDSCEYIWLRCDSLRRCPNCGSRRLSRWQRGNEFSRPHRLW